MAMTNDELTELLNRLLVGWENEVVEFKEATRQFSADKTGEYVSALSNEANLRGLTSGWLVFGVSNSRQIVGTLHLTEVQQRQTLKHHIHQSIDQGLTIREVYEVVIDGKRVVLLEVPAAPRGIPISWKGDYRARAGESLVPLSLDKLDEIRRQTIGEDWTAVVVPEATLGHLDPAAIARARQGFIERYPRLRDQIDVWDDLQFLEKARLTRDGALTRAALLLLGKPTSTHLLSPHIAEISWKLVGEEEAYEHLSIPFLSAATAASELIRNVQLRLLPPNELIYREVSKYNQRSLLEALYNCIAHQDYRRMSRITVMERVDRVEFISSGNFFDRTPEAYMLSEQVPRSYRNPFLVAAMTELNLIDHMGNGIYRIAQDQIHRFLPLPSYDLSDPDEVKLTIYGAVIDPEYTRLLMVRTDLPIEDIVALDRVQKGLPITDEAVARLRSARLVEGRRPHLRVSQDIAKLTGNLPKYLRERPQPDAHYAKLVLDLIDTLGSASRRDIDLMLMPLLHDLSVPEKAKQIGNLLTRMRRNGQIKNRGSRAKPEWERA
ncbi:MAG: putative DNA binding domain-containing protein [Ancrocorticia sp.]